MEGNYQNFPNKCLVIVSPHTSWHDFYIGLLARNIFNQKFNFIAKKELFVFPFNYFFKWLGGAPLDRTGGLNKVDVVAAEFNKHQIFRLAMAPEGTRKKVDKFRTGFYYIAQKAKIPIIPVAMDWQTKTIRVGEPILVSENFEADMQKIMQHFKGAIGKIPAYTMTI